jgi:hypothetical protein
MSITWDHLTPREPVVIKDGVPKQIKITSYRFGELTLTDAATGQSKTVPGLILSVNAEDGAPVNKDLNIVSKRLAAKLRPYLERQVSWEQTFTITAQGTGLETDYSLEVK